jgi:hypothetical protein
MPELPSTEDWVKVLIAALEILPAKYKGKDKSLAALGAVSLTRTILLKLNVDPGVLAPLFEAQLIIQRSLGRTEKKQQMERDIVDCLALFHQRRCNVKSKDALRAIVGTNLAAQTHLENFYKKMMAGKKREARALFDEFNKRFDGVPSQKAMKATLQTCAALRGRKVQNAR